MFLLFKILLHETKNVEKQILEIRVYIIYWQFGTINNFIDNNTKKILYQLIRSELDLDSFNSNSIRLVSRGNWCITSSYR